jgi:hypothetical protein
MAHYDQGLYDCIIKSQGFDVSKEKKTPCFWLRFLPVKKDGEEIDAEYEREIKMWLTDGTINRVIDRLRSLGWKGSSFKELEPGGKHAFAGTNCQLRCEHEQNGSTVYEQWEFPAPRSAPPENKTGVAKKLDALFGKALKGKPVSAEPVATATSETDDCPF